MSVVTRILSVFRSIAIVIAIAIVFLFGVATTVYLSLRSPEVKVPDVVGKNRFEAEKILADADLKFRVRATRPSTEAQPDTVMFQLPRGGEVVLKPGAAAAAQLQLVNVANFDAGVCRPTPVRGLRVYPPGETAALFIPLPTAPGGYGECSVSTTQTLLSVGYLQPGTQPG